MVTSARGVVTTKHGEIFHTHHSDDDFVNVLYNMVVCLCHVLYFVPNNR